MGGCSVLLEMCAQCGSGDALARGFCAKCGSSNVSPREVSGAAVVWSFTVVHRPPSGDCSEDLPYGIALVDVGCGVRMMVRVPVELTIGQQIEIERTDLNAPPKFVGMLHSD